MATLTQSWYTPEEYLALERKAEYKSEYVNGQIYAMAGASEAHNLVAGNVFSGIHSQLRGRPRKVYMNDMRVKVSHTRMYTYPDVIAVCGEPHLEDEELDTLTNPTVIIEVLSPSTEAYDRGKKFAHYRKLESLVEYVLVSQDKALVEHFVRRGGVGDEWVFNETAGLDGTLRLTSIGCEVSLADIYDKVEFPGDETFNP